MFCQSNPTAVLSLLSSPLLLLKLPNIGGRGGGGGGRCWGLNKVLSSSLWYMKEEGKELNS